jgi:hypothetical protein
MIIYEILFTSCSKNKTESLAVTQKRTSESEGGREKDREGVCVGGGGMLERGRNVGKHCGCFRDIRHLTPYSPVDIYMDVSVKLAVHIVEIGECAVHGNDGVDTATSWIRAELWLRGFECEGVEMFCLMVLSVSKIM